MIKKAAAFIFLIFVPTIALSAQKTTIESNAEILKRVWKLGSEKFCDEGKQSQFNESNFSNILKNVHSTDDRNELAKALNPFLFSLGWSHTEFMPDSSESYYFLKSHEAMVNPKAARAPKIVNPGLQVGKDDKGYFVREILDGFPAQSSGLKKLDRLSSLNGQAFNGTWGKTPAQNQVEIEREGKKQTIWLKTESLDWSASFQKATENSVYVFTTPNGRRVGYVHLWSGVHPKSAALLQKIVKKFKADQVDGVILDLRGGYGGAWWNHLDPFFADTSSYMEMEAERPDGKNEVLKSPFKKNKSAYLGSMVVLINEGVRSGKEALAYQFKKTKRAWLIGEKTPGYFSTGQYFFADEPKDFIFYMCVFKIQLDRVQIEGVGIKPDEAVGFSASGKFQDSQLEAGLDFFEKSPAH